MTTDFQVIVGSKRDDLPALRRIQAQTAVMADEARRNARVLQLRQPAKKTRALEREVEAEVGLDAMKLRAYALHIGAGDTSAHLSSFIRLAQAAAASAIVT